MLFETNSLDKYIIYAYCNLLLSGKTPIKVSDISREATISRGTFYLHFKNIKILNDYIESKTLHEVTKLWQTDYPSLNDEPALIKKIEIFFEFISDNKIIFSGLLLNKEQTNFKNSLNRCIYNSLFGFRTVPKKHIKNKEMYNFNYVSVAMIEIIETWLKKHRPESPSDMATVLDYLLSHSLGEIYLEVKQPINKNST